MKRYTFLSILFLFLAGFMSSCYEDKGNYDYNWSPEVVLKAKNSGLRDTVIKRGQQLTIKPNLRLLTGAEGTDRDTTDFRPEDYTYRWVAYQNSLNSESFVLATTQNLDTVINLPLNTSAYHVLYSVREKKTGVDYTFSFKLRVETRYINAWLFLTEDDAGTADLTLYGKEVGNTSEDPWVFEYNVLERSGFPYRGGGAKFVYYFSPKNYIMVGTGKGSGWLGKNDLDWNEKQMLRYMMAMPQSMDYTFEGVEQLGVWHFIGSDGSIYPMGNIYLTGDAYNNLPPAVTGADRYQKVKLAPFVGGASSRNLIYDETNDVMLIYKGGSGNTASTTNAVALPENLKLRNHKIFFMQTYGLSLTNVYAKNKADNKYYRYTYDSYNQGDPKLSEPFEIINGDLLEQGEQFVSDNLNGFFYMSVENKLYVLRGHELREVTVNDPDGIVTGGFHGFDNICLLTRYTNIESTRTNVMVATYSGVEKSGKIYYLQPNSIEAMELTVKTYFENMDRVKGISRF